MPYIVRKNVLDLPPGIIEQLEKCPVRPNHGVYNWIYTTTLMLARWGHPQHEAEELIYKYGANCGKPNWEKDVVRQVANAYATVSGTPPVARGAKCGNGGGSTAASAPPKPAFNAETLAKAAAAGPRFESMDEVVRYFATRSPLPIDQGPIHFINSVFEPGEICCVVKTMNQWRPHFVVAGDPTTPDLPDDITLESGSGALFLANPIDGKQHPQVDGSTHPDGSPKTSFRNETAITAGRNLVIEMDPHDDQGPGTTSRYLMQFMSFIAAWKAPIVSITTSGSKSIHVMVRINADTKAEFETVVGGIKPTLIELGADPNAMRWVQLTRLPFCCRSEKASPLDPYRGVQQLLFLNSSPDSTPIVEMSVCSSPSNRFS